MKSTQGHLSPSPSFFPDEALYGEELFYTFRALLREMMTNTFSSLQYENFTEKNPDSFILRGSCCIEMRKKIKFSVKNPIILSLSDKDLSPFHCGSRKVKCFIKKLQERTYWGRRG